MIDNSFPSHMHTLVVLQTGLFFCHTCMWTTATPHSLSLHVSSLQCSFAPADRLCWLERVSPPRGESVQYTCVLVCAFVRLFLFSTAFTLWWLSLWGPRWETFSFHYPGVLALHQQPVELASCCCCMSFLFGSGFTWRALTAPTKAFFY